VRSRPNLKTYLRPAFMTPGNTLHVEVVLTSGSETPVDFVDLRLEGSSIARDDSAASTHSIVALAALIAVVVVVPTWWSSLDTNSTANGDTPYLAASAWAEHNVPKNDTVVVDDYLWVDLKTHGLNPLWIWKISAQTAPSYKSIQYIILQPQSPGTLAGMPALQGAYAHSVLVKDFGNGLTVRRVNDAG